MFKTSQMYKDKSSNKRDTLKVVDSEIHEDLELDIQSTKDLVKLDITSSPD